MTLDSRDLPTIQIEQVGQLTTIKLKTADQRPQGSDIHWDLGEVMSRLRGDNSTRVIVITGLTDGVFLVPAAAGTYLDPTLTAHYNDPERHWRVMTGMTRFHEAITSIEKPVIAKVNGDAVGFGQSILFACDLAVVRDDALIFDQHMTNGESGLGTPYGIVPGDGGVALTAAHMTPMRAKEYLMLGRVFEAAELAAMGAINYAVPLAELDAKVSELVEGLLKQSAYALAWTKRLANRTIVRDMHMSLDAGSAFELVNFYQAERNSWRSQQDL